MPGTIFGMPFDAEIFGSMWRETPDPVLTAMFDSGAVMNDPTIGGLISNGSDIYTVPFYNPLDGDPSNHDGQTDIVATEVAGTSMTGCVFGRDRAFFSRDFTAELAKNDPQGHIARAVSRYWAKQKQKEMINTLTGIFKVTGSGNDKLFHDNHIVDLGSTTGTPYEIGVNDDKDAATKALGDNRDKFTLVFMHSVIANRLEKQQVLEYWKYTDAMGIQRNTNLASWGGKTVIVDDGVPAAKVGGSGANKDLMAYHTYMLGSGAIRYSEAAPLEEPAESYREPLKNGGQSTLITRTRMTMHPNGFTFVKPASGYVNSATRAQLALAASWKTAFNHKALPFVDIVTNG